jgi:hypothetical protein
MSHKAVLVESFLNSLRRVCGPAVFGNLMLSDVDESGKQVPTRVLGFRRYPGDDAALPAVHSCRFDKRTQVCPARRRAAIAKHRASSDTCLASLGW